MPDPHYPEVTTQAGECMVTEDACFCPGRRVFLDGEGAERGGTGENPSLPDPSLATQPDKEALASAPAKQSAQR